MNSEINNELVHIRADLPTPEKNEASCQIYFNCDRLKAITITLEHKQLLKIFQCFETPFRARKKTYLRWSPFMPQKNDIFWCTLGNCEFGLEECEAINLIAAFDQLWQQYIAQVELIEEKWGTKNFELISGVGDDVALIPTGKGEWLDIIAFVEERKEKSSCFSENIYLDYQPQNQYVDNGIGTLYVYAREGEENRQVTAIVPCQGKYDEFLLSWKSPEQTDLVSTAGNDYQWDAETTYVWLIDSLMPAVEYEARDKKSLLPWLDRWTFRALGEKSYEDFCENYKQKNDNYHGQCRSTLLKKIQQRDEDCLFELICLLYEYYKYYQCYRSWCTYVSLVEYQNLYSSLMIFVDNSKSNPSSREFESISKKQERINLDAHRASRNYFSEILDVLFCLKQLCKEETQLQECQKKEIIKLLQPILRKLYQQQLLERQCQRKGQQLFKD